jgi:hypothetical protein
MSQTAAPGSTLTKRIQSYYPLYGVDAKGLFIGAEEFQLKMVKLSHDYPDQVVRAEINRMIR